MTPAARIAAAAEILDRILAGEAAEPALTGWARGHRFAGSGDRAAIRDHVFDALRCRRSCAALGGGETGRGLMLGLLRAAGTGPETVFTGEGHAPAPLTPEERAAPDPAALPELVALDCPDWLAPALKDSLGPDFAPVLAAMRARAPAFLRANLVRGTREAAIAALAAEGIATRPSPLAKTALEATENARKIQGSAAYRDGLVELQDAASQAMVERLPLAPGMRVLDYCAGGGGKTLAMAARAPGAYFVHDAAPARMRDLPARAARAGIAAEALSTADLARAAPFDLVLLDAPCSGSGTWARAPEAKWRLTPARLAELTALQDRILREGAALAATEGALAYMTCSLLEAENAARIRAFLADTPGWRLAGEARLTPLDGGDGFYMALLLRA